MEHLNLQDFDYELPQELIAQFPAEPRDSSRLCVFSDNRIAHRRFSDITDYFRKGDCLVLNDTKVIPARLLGSKKTGGQVEVFLLEKGSDQDWIVMGRPGRYLRKGEVLYFDQDITAEVLTDNLEKGKRVVRFSASTEALFSIGHVPLPPYIRRDDLSTDRDRYQTVYAEKEGAVAAPTAGLHFTPVILEKLKAKGVAVAKTTLHVSLGTFRPIEVDDIRHHKMDAEYFEVGQEACQTINSVRAAGGRIFAAGTTAAKALESAAQWGMPLGPHQGKSDLFIHPGFEFKVVDALITNFHMPKSTLLLLVSAFAGYHNLMNMYREAVKEQYRFLSYGDATLLIP